MRAGRSVAAAIAAGYKKGLSTIVDANIVTLLVAFILFILATAGVKGFAFMLGIGTIVSLFTAVLATQAILLSLRDSRDPAAPRRARRRRARSARSRFDFMGASKWFFSMSGLILLIGALAIAGKGINFGIDFESRHADHRAARSRPATVERGPHRAARRRASATRRSRRSRTRSSAPARRPGLDRRRSAPKDVGKVKQRARASASGSRDQPNVESIGPTFGQSVANSALIAIIASLAVISIYIALRFEWKFAVPVLIALMHDILITAGVYALVGREVTTSTVAALLTIVGFSLYDTIIVFDRIRENVPRMPSAAFSQIVNRSMSEVIVALAGDVVLHAPAGARAVLLRRRHAQGLRVRADRRHRSPAPTRRSSSPRRCSRTGRSASRSTAARERRIRAELGYLPAYAVPLGGAPVDVAPSRAARGRAPVTAPADPSQVSREEFDAMVRDLGIEEAQRQTAGTGAPQRPPGGRPARAGQRRPHRRQRPGRAGERPRSRRAAATRRREAAEAAQPQAREAALMAMLVWAMMGLAIWHFTIFLPDRFWGGIVGAFLGALFGAIIFGLIVNGFSDPRRGRHPRWPALEAIPGALARHRDRLLRRRARGQRGRVGGPRLAAQQGARRLERRAALTAARR